MVGSRVRGGMKKRVAVVGRVGEVGVCRDGTRV